MAKVDGRHFTSSDVPPFVKHGAGNPYKLRLMNPEIDGSQLMLFDGSYHLFAGATPQCKGFIPLDSEGKYNVVCTPRPQM